MRAGRWSYWHEREGYYEGGWYDLHEGESWIGWTPYSDEAVRWVMEGVTGNRTVRIRTIDEAAEIIIQHTLDGVS